MNIALEFIVVNVRQLGTLPAGKKEERLGLPYDGALRSGTLIIAPQARK